MRTRNDGLWRWLWLSPAMVLAQAAWCSLHGRVLGLPAVGFDVALPWALKSAAGWTLAGIALGAVGHHIFSAPLARTRRWTVRALVVAAVFAITLSCETWLLSGNRALAAWLYERAPLHFTFAALLVGGYLLLRARHESQVARAAAAPAPSSDALSVGGTPPSRDARPTSESQPADPRPEPIIVEVMTGTGRTQVRLDDIECLEADRNYINVHTSQRTYLLRQTLSSLEKALKSRDFMRIHRSTIVNRAMIREKRGGGVLVLRSGRVVRISRAFARQLN